MAAKAKQAAGSKVKTKAKAKVKPKAKTKAQATANAATAKKAVSAKQAVAGKKNASGKKAPSGKKDPSGKKAPSDKKAPGGNAAAKKSPKTAKSRRSANTAASAQTVTATSGYSNPEHWKSKRLTLKGDRPLIKTLLAEHKHMASVMQLFSEQLDVIAAGQMVDPHLVYEIMDYMVTWPDRFHHPREDLIYARVAELDSAGADEVDTLQRDHDNTAQQGKELLAEVASWRDGVLSGEELIKHGRAYIAHIFEHMNVEEKVVFPHIESVLTAQDWRQLEAEDQLEAVSLPVFGPKVQREFRTIARKLRRGVRQSVERQAVSQLMDLEALMESVDVVSMALESSRYTAGAHLRDAVQQAGDIVLENPLTAPWRMALNNARVTAELVGDVAEISRETFADIVKINRARRDWNRRLDQVSESR